MKKTVLHQLRTGEKPAEGMSYIIEADDGSIIVIDGGMTDYEGDQITEYLKKITGQKPVTVDAWFITHAHLDHTYALQSAALRHSDEISVKKVIYRFPDKDFINRVQPKVNEEIPVFEKALENFAGMEKLTPSTGDRYEFGSTVFDVLFTCADLPSLEEMPGQSINDTSTVLRMTAEGQTILFLSDAQPRADAVMTARWGKALKSDVCQVAHHGANGSTPEFYDLVDPEILLWPAREDRFGTMMMIYEANRHLIRDMRVKDVIIAFHGTSRMELPIRPRVKPYLPEVPKDKAHWEPALKIPYGAPAMDRADDEIWNRCEAYPMIPNQKYPENVSAESRFLWDEQALYIRVDFRGDFVPSDPQRVGTAQCNNLRLYFCERAVTDLDAKWEEVCGEGVYDKLRIYPETKILDGREATATHPEICQNAVFFRSGGYTLIARVAFVKAHQKGDRMSVNLELSAVKIPGGNRAYTFYSVPALEGRACHLIPAALAVAQLL